MKNNKFNIKYLPMDIGRAVYFIFSLFYRPVHLDLNGKRHKAALKGGAIIVANHSGFGDPLALGVSFYYRRVFFLVAEAVMKNRILAFLLRGMGCIRIDRNISDIEAINKCTAVLKKEKLLVMFPQGNIDREDKIDAVKSGAVLLSIRANVPIIPVYSLPKNHFYEKRIFIVGEAINCKELINKKFPSVSDMEKAAELMRDRLCELKDVYERIVNQ